MWDRVQWGHETFMNNTYPIERCGSMKKAILTATGLCKSYAHNSAQAHVLNHVSLELYEGDYTVVMGASGSGKSTLLYTLSGMDNPTAGQILYKGENIAAYPESKLTRLRQGDFGFIFQQMHLVSNLTLFENVAVPGLLGKGVSHQEIKARTKELLARMGLADMMSRLPSQVSGGEQQRAAIARAVISRPRLLFADEPTGALNRKNTIEVLDLLTDMNREGQSLLMVTHDLRATLRASRILYLEDGRIIGELPLSPYSPEDEKSRETQVNAWLSSMKW